MPDKLERAEQHGFWSVLRPLFMSAADRANAVNRGITEYQPNQIDAFFEPEQGFYNALISGGSPALRNSALVAQAACAIQNHFPVVILHEGNRLLEQQMRFNFSGLNRYQEISRQSPRFEPLYRLTEQEIANQVLETALKKSDLKHNVRPYIEGMGAYLRLNKRHLSFQMFSTFPHSLIFDRVEALHSRGVISESREQEIKSKLMMGQSEAYKLDSFLKDLKMEIEPFMYRRKHGYKPLNVLSAIQSCDILCFDIASVTNQLLMNTIIFQLRIALTKGLPYLLLIDSIPLQANEAYAAYLKSPSDKVCKTIAADDFYAMTGGDDKLFSSIAGNSQILVIMGHASGSSALKWAEVLGQYDMYEESYSVSKGYSRRTPFSIFASPSQNRVISTSKKREYIVKPEQITHMGNGEAYILTLARGELAHLILTG